MLYAITNMAKDNFGLVAVAAAVERLRQERPAVHMDRLAGQIARLRSREITHRSRDVLWAAASTEQRRAGFTMHRLGAVALGIDEPRRDEVGRDIAFGELHGQRFGQPV